MRRARTRFAALAGLALATLALAGCPLRASTATTLATSRPASAGAAAATTATDPSSPAEASRPGTISGAIVRHQLATLIGLTPDQAKAELKRLGHDGAVHIAIVIGPGGGQGYVKDCGVDKVCSTSDESGTGIHDDITLYINPTLTIAPPPE